MDALVSLLSFFVPGVLHTKVLGGFVSSNSDRIERALRHGPLPSRFLAIFQRFSEDRLSFIMYVANEKSLVHPQSQPREFVSRKLSRKLLAQGREAVSINYWLHHRGYKKPC